MNNNSPNNINNVQGVVVTSTPKIEVAPIQNGIVQDTIKTGDIIVPTDNSIKNKKWFSFAILIIFVVIFFATLVIIAVFNSIKKNEGLVGTVKDGYLMYENPEKGNNIDFSINDNLTLTLSVTNVDYEENVGSEVTYSLSVRNGSEKIENRTTWLDDNNYIFVYFDQVGDNVIIKDDDSYIKYGDKLDIFYPDKTIKQLFTIDNSDGLYIDDYSVKDDTLVVNYSRIINKDTVFYFNKDLSGQNIDEDLSNGFSICSDDITYIDGSLIVSGSYIYSLNDNLLDLSKYKISNDITLNEYLSSSFILYCQ